MIARQRISTRTFAVQVFSEQDLALDEREPAQILAPSPTILANGKARRGRW
jgi:hypothetical protein